MTDESSWAWNAPDRVNKMFPLFLKKLFHFKKPPGFYEAPESTTIVFKSFVLECDVIDNYKVWKI